MKPPKILILCSGRIAVIALRSLANAGALCAVVCPAGDPQTAALMQEVAGSVRVPFYTVARKDIGHTLSGLLKEYAAEAAFVIGFPWRIPAQLLTLPRHGFLNFHAGPLPELRGPDPIFEAIRQQRTETALTIHQMTSDLDAGPVVWQERFAIPPDCTHGLLVTAMAFQAEAACRTLLNTLQTTALAPTPQDETRARYWPRLLKEKLFIDWRDGASDIVALIRACNPVYGGAATLAGGWCIRITEASVLQSDPNPEPAAPGAILTISLQQGLVVQCGDGNAIRADVIGTDEGYFPGTRLFSFGIAPGTVLQNHFAMSTSHLSNTLQTTT